MGEVKTLLSLAALVVDARSKAPIPDATLRFLDATRHRAAHVTSDGYRVFVGIPPGPARVQVTAPGYRTLDTSVEIPTAPTLANAVLEFSLERDADFRRR
ncbi:carboxypeptidase-like regulatory domain-containing protein [Sorangium sp. So ce726]|uniref:carboxypeptidase-like regulatory domain-containing protein n=1 Tax=Sorangium sp. So ce726 TaxID=3133319 RepID=UPI003F5F19E3